MSGISVIVTTFNRTQYLSEAIQSILNQSRPVQEILLVNDASESSFLPELQRITDLDPRIRRIDNRTNLGVAACRNLGIDQARGNYISFLDDDDTLELTCMDQLAGLLDNAPSVDAALCDTAVHPDSISNPNSQRLVQLLGKRIEAYPHLEVNSSTYFLVFCPMVHSFLFRKSCFERTRFPEGYHYGEDLWCWLSMVNCGLRFRKVDLIGSLVRVHEHSPRYSYSVKKQWHKDLFQSEILDREGRRMQAMRLVLFHLRHGKIPGLATCGLALTRPITFFKYALFQLRAGW